MTIQFGDQPAVISHLGDSAGNPTFLKLPMTIADEVFGGAGGTLLLPKTYSKRCGMAPLPPTLVLSSSRVSASPDSDQGDVDGVASPNRAPTLDGKQRWYNRGDGWKQT